MRLAEPFPSLFHRRASLLAGIISRWGEDLGGFHTGEHAYRGFLNPALTLARPPESCSNPGYF